MSDDDKPRDDSTLDEKIISIKTHAETFLRRFSNKDDSYKTSKAVGNQTIAAQLSVMLDGELLPQYLIQAIERFGAPKVDAVVRRIVQQMETSKISNLAAYFNKAMLTEHQSEKTSLSNQNQPSSGIDSLDRNSNLSGNKNSSFSRGVSNSNAIDDLKKEHYWPLAWNKNFYRRLSRSNRQDIIDQVANKWFYLHEHAKHFEIDLLGSEFTDHNLFIPFSEILNNIRLEQAAHPLRSRIWNES